jgi:hypothetical protein
VSHKVYASPVPVRVRRRRYAMLRRSGINSYEAIRQIGLDPAGHSPARYERWFQAVERGETDLSRSEETK